MEDQSWLLLQQLLPSSWIMRRCSKDYGVDAEVEIVDAGAVTGERVWIQLKARRCIPRRIWRFKPRIELDPEITQDGSLSVEYVQARVDTRLLEYALQCPFPLLLMEADLSTRQVYWLPLRDDILVSVDKRCPQWRAQRNVTLKIPSWNELLRDREFDHYGIRWYGREPARLFALSCLQHYFHEFQYMRNVLPREFANGDPLGMVDFVWSPFPRERVEYELRRMKDAIEHALRFEVLFGKTGIEIFQIHGGVLLPPPSLADRCWPAVLRTPAMGALPSCRRILANRRVLRMA
jgi:hypothetical protein